MQMHDRERFNFEGVHSFLNLGVWIAERGQDVQEMKARIAKEN